MNNELMKKAWEHFGGAWPKDEDQTIPIEHERLGLCVSSYKEFGSDAYICGDLRLVGSGVPNDKWEIICDRQQFETYGASLEKDWMPEDGQECEYDTTFFVDPEYRTGICTIVARHKDRVWIDIEGKNNVVINTKVITFRPIKTEREEFIEMAIDDYLVQVGSDAVNPKWFDRVFGAMYDADYRKND